MSIAVPENDEVVSSVAGYVKVRLNTLQAFDAAAVDLYVRYKSGGLPVLYCRSGSPLLDSQKFHELAEAEVNWVYVREDDFSRFACDSLASLTSFFQQDGVSVGEKFAALQLAVAVKIDQALRLVDCGKYHLLAEKVSRVVVSLLAANDVSPRDLFRFARHDFNTFTHVTNVAGYSIILAERLGVRDRRELEQIAAGAMLHDIGMRVVPAKILTKRGQLDPEEQAIIQTHTVRGYEELCDRPGLNFGQLMMVYQHHERVDGTGYPVEILTDEIHPWAKLLSVVDVFDALTAERPYRRPASAESALAYQRRQAGTHFDQEVVECWISAMTQV